MNMDKLHESMNKTVAKQRRKFLIHELNRLGIKDLDSLSLAELEREHIKAKVEEGKKL